MGLKNVSMTPAEIRELRRDIEEWRRSGSRGVAMPEVLWRRAAQLAKEYSVSQIAQELKLGYRGLRKRMEGSARKRDEQSRGSFVELPISSFQSERSSVTEVEVTRQDGTRFRLRHTGNVDVSRLVATALGGS